MALGQRIKQRRKELNLTQAALAKMANVKRGVITQLELRDSGSTENIIEFARALDTSVEYLLLGKNKQNSQQIKTLSKPSKDIARIPKLSATTSIGYGVPDNLEHDIQIEGVDLSMSWIRNKLQTISQIKNLRIITALGDSMSGTFENGDAVFVDTGIIELTVDGVYAIRHDGELFIKRVSRLPFGKYKIKSDNDKYETFVISKKDKTHFQIIGKVVGSLNFNTI